MLKALCDTQLTCVRDASLQLKVYLNKKLLCELLAQRIYEFYKRESVSREIAWSALKLMDIVS